MKPTATQSKLDHLLIIIAASKMPKIPPPFYAYPWKSAPPNFNFIQTMKPTRYPVEELLKFAPKELETSVARLGQSRARVIAEHAAAQEAPSTTLEDELKPKSPPTPKKVAFAETAELIGEKGGSTKLEKPEGKTDEKTIGESTEIAIQKMGKKDEEWDYRKDPLWNPGGGNIPPPKDQPKAEAADGEEGTKKKKKKRSKVNADGTPKVKKPAPTGFEEYYADAPITPFEFKEERDVIYNQ